MADVGDFDDLVLGRGEAGKYLAWEPGEAARGFGVGTDRAIGSLAGNVSSSAASST